MIRSLVGPIGQEINVDVLNGLIRTEKSVTRLGQEVCAIKIIFIYDLRLLLSRC